MGIYEPYNYSIWGDDGDDEESKILGEGLGLSDSIWGVEDDILPTYAEVVGSGFFKTLGNFSKSLAKKGVAAGKIALNFAKDAYANPTVRKAVNDVIEMGGEYLKDQLSESNAAIPAGLIIDEGLDTLKPERVTKRKKKESDKKKREQRAKPKEEAVEDLHRTIFTDTILKEGEGFGKMGMKPAFTNPYLVGLNSL